MDLYTHYAFGLVVGLVFFSSPIIALLIGLGALLPDLDREYWFVRTKKYVDQQKTYAETQVHRARFHNVFILALTYPISPFLAIGVFLHILQDSFTTAKDRGVEWFHPLTRLVKRGLKDAQGSPQQLSPDEQVYFYQEDPKGLVNNADPDLREVGPDPVPWRRVYGFAQNSHLLDKSFLFGSLGVFLVWLVSPLDLSNFLALVRALLNGSSLLWLGYLGVGLLYLAGETDRRDLPARFPELKPLQWPILIAGVGVFALWLVFYATRIVGNLQAFFSSTWALLEGIGAVVAIYVFIVWRVRTDKKKGIPTVV